MVVLITIRYSTGYECAVRGDDKETMRFMWSANTMLGVLSMEEVEMTRFSVMDTPFTAMKETTTYLLTRRLILRRTSGYFLELLAPSWESDDYNGGPGADTFNCSSVPGDIVEDYNPMEGDSVSADCETV